MKAATIPILLFKSAHSISIHAAREGGDRVGHDANQQSVISIHAAREGGDRGRYYPPLRIKISIHAAREGGDQIALNALALFCGFQSTPPVKAATRKRPSEVPSFLFQSTPPVKAATMMSLHVAKTTDISIHAAREGGDDIAFLTMLGKLDFNPRRP